MTDNKELIERLERALAHYSSFSGERATFDDDEILTIGDLREVSRALNDCSFLKAQISHLEDALQNAEARVNELKDELAVCEESRDTYFWNQKDD